MSNSFDEDARARLIKSANARSLLLAHQTTEWRQLPGSLAHGAVCELCKAWGFISPNEPWFYGPLLTKECSAAQPGGDLVPLRPLPKDMVGADYADLGFAGSYSSPFADWLIVAGLAIVTIIAGLIVYEFEHIAVGHAGIVAHMQATHPAGG